MSVSEKVGSGAIALLLVMSVLAPFAVGTASADTYTKTVDSSRAVVIETSGTDEAQIEIKGTYTKNGEEYTHFLRRVTVTGDYKHYLVDLKAYDSYDVTVQTSSGTTTVDIYGSDYAGGGSGYNSIGHTGGDTDLQCGLGAQAGSMLGTYFTDCNPVPSQSINTTELDANDTKLSIYESGLTQKTAQDNHITTQDNYLEDARSIALMRGKNAYIRALNNGSTQTTAESKAKTAVADYYTMQQINLINSWNTTIAHSEYLVSRSNNETGVSQQPYGTEFNVNAGYIYNDGNIYGNGIEAVIDKTGTASVTLANGSSVNTLYVDNLVYDSEGGTKRAHAHVNPAFTKSDYTVAYNDYKPEYDEGTDKIELYDGTGTVYSQGINISAPNSNYDTQHYVHYGDYIETYRQIQDQNDQVQVELETYVNNTYDAYQDGDLTNEDLIDPYVAYRQYSPDPANYSSWAAHSLTLLGQNSPDTLENTGNFSVTDETDGTTYNGILMTDENPDSGSFQTGETYDSANLSGSQFVVTDESVHELDGKFTVNSISQKDGTEVNEAEYRNINYSTSTVEGYQEVLDNISNVQADIEALQLAAASGGGTSDTGPPDFVAELLKSVGAPVNPLTRGAAVVGGGTGILAVVGRVIAG